MEKQRLQTDFVTILEAIYSLDQPADTWLKHIMQAAAPALDEGVGIGGVLYLLSCGKFCPGICTTK